jgi:hypothetical protein
LAEQIENALFEGLDRKKVDFEPIITMAAEYFTHLGVICTHPLPPFRNLMINIMIVMNQGGPKSRGDTPLSVSDIVEKETEELIRIATEGKGYRKRKQAALKALVHDNVA